MSLLKRIVAPPPGSGTLFRPVIFPPRPEPAPPPPPPPEPVDPNVPLPPNLGMKSDGTPRLRQRPGHGKTRGNYIPTIEGTPSPNMGKRRGHAPKVIDRNGHKRHVADPVVSLAFTVTVTEAKLLRAAAHEAGAKSFSSWCRVRLLGPKHE